ncbi:MAG: hypothetical protein GF384_08360 [Elusimicrobia bacterium]|nr:hypothetical protein [Elusimicrobiota bacterium]MBD3412640.1 hypothetical protein [Elusimicrobiota bacterium]
MFKLFANATYNQVKTLTKPLLGYPLTTPPLASATLDMDDVQIAREALRADCRSWHDEQPVNEYETKFKTWNGSGFAFAFMGARVALSAAIYALDLKAGDEVILPGYTCVVVPNAFQYTGITPQYCDIELDTYGLDASKLTQKISSKTKAIVLHHLYGLVSRDYEKIISICRDHNCAIIEDCAQSTGAVYKNRRIGNYGDIAVYSSEQTKVFSTVQGGIATTNNATLAQRLADYAQQAPHPSDDHIARQLHTVIFSYASYKDPFRWIKADLMSILHANKNIITTTTEEVNGVKPAHYGCKMPAPIARLGINQLKKIDQYNTKRRQTANRWDAWCAANGYAKPVVIADSEPVFLRYPVLVEPEKKKNLQWAHKELGVIPGVWYSSHIHPSSKPVTGCPNADRAVAQCINFPGLIV